MLRKGQAYRLLPSFPRTSFTPATFASMQRHDLSYAATGLFGRAALDVLDDAPAIHPLRHAGYHREGLAQAMEARAFPEHQRSALVEALRRQYRDVAVTPAVEASMGLLALEGTCTITTGHQLCLAGGPAFVLFKVLNAVRLARELTTPGRPVVPVFWMASEDHDLAEVDHVVLRGTNVHWEPGLKGAVGRMRLHGMARLLSQIQGLLGPDAPALGALLREAYTDGRTLADATRHLMNGLFGHLGLVVLDGDDAALKRLFAPTMRRELAEGFVLNAVGQAVRHFPAGHAVQAHARAVNLFLLDEGSRRRIERSGDGVQVLDGGPRLAMPEVLDLLDSSPERFSPNVLMRPLYQETVLPNVAYVGGGGELAYWLQLRWAFEAAGLRMPVAVLRTSAVFLGAEAIAGLQRLGLSLDDLFADVHAVERRLAGALSSFPVSVDAERAAMRAFYGGLGERAAAVGPDLRRSVASAEQRAMNALDRIGQRFLRAAKQRQQVALGRYHALRGQVFPGGHLQERHEGFVALLADQGLGVVDELLNVLDPLEKRFSVLVPAHT